jgi:L-serine dehydratase
METISAFDMLKIGVGPSSSHTMGPWRAVQRWLRELEASIGLSAVRGITLHLYGSLALTGRGHATDQALCLALLGYEPETVPVERIGEFLDELCARAKVTLGGNDVPFDPSADIIFHKDQRLPGHANGMRFVAKFDKGESDTGETESIFYSIGGGFILKEGESAAARSGGVSLPFPCQSGAELEKHCAAHSMSIAATSARGAPTKRCTRTSCASGT